MNVNWDKSLIIKLGIDFPLLENDTIEILPHGQKTRVFGVMMGHEEDITEGWIKLYDKLKNTVCNKVRSVNSQIGDTLTMNTVAVSSANYVASFQIMTIIGTCHFKFNSITIGFSSFVFFGYSAWSKLVLCAN